MPRNSRAKRSRDSVRSDRYRLRFESLEPRRLLVADPIISEFLADNDKILLDGDLQSSDWIEIFNRGDESIDLAGWYLTDNAADLTKWSFPSTPLDAGDYLVVFASGQKTDDYADSLGYLHTNFSLDDDGEYLALVRPDGATIVSQYAPDGGDFPEQFEDVSYGLGRVENITTLVGPAAAAGVLVPTAADDALIGADWVDPEFVPGAAGETLWTEATAGVGFADTIDGLDTWFKADQITGLDSGDLVSVWPDGTGHGHDAVQIDEDSQPIWIADGLNGQPVVRFDGLDTYLESDSLWIGADTTVFFVSQSAVQQANDGSIHRAILAWQGNPYQASGTGYGFGHLKPNTSPQMNISLGNDTVEQKLAVSTTMDEQFHIWSFVRDGSAANKAQLYENGQAVGGPFTFDRTTGLTAGYNIGADPNNTARFYKGDIAEILVFNRTLTDAEHRAVLKYLSQEYAVSIASPLEASLVMQLDGSSAAIDGGTFTWSDLSEGGHDAVQSDPAKQPVVIPAELGGHDVVRFDGTDDVLALSDLLLGADTTVFFVSRNTPQTSGGSIHRAILAWQGNPYQATGTGYGFGHYRADATASLNISLGDGTTEQKLIAPTIMDDQFRIWSFTRDGSATNTAELFEDGVQVGGPFTFNRTTGLTAGYNLGGDPNFSRFYKGDVAEILVYNRQLTSEEHNQVGAYLEEKYGLDTAFVSDRALQAYWTFDDGTATDQVGSHDGIAFEAGATTSADVPAVGGSQSLDLTHGNDYVTLPADTYGISDEYTISAWIKRVGDGRFFSIKRDLTSGGGDRSGVNFGVSGTELFSGVISSGSNNAANGGDTYNDIKTSTGVDVPAGQWVHVAVTLKDDQITMYVNGVAETVYTDNTGTTSGMLKVLGTDIDFVDTNGSFSGLGADGYAWGDGTHDGPDFTSNYYNGLLDELAVWDAALSADQIAALAAGTVSPLDLVVPDPVIPDVPPASFEGAAYPELAGTDLEASMLDVGTSAYIRIPFEVTDPDELHSLYLRMQYDDGFVAYLNGVEIARRNAPGDVGTSPAFDAAATASRTQSEALQGEWIDVSAYKSLLQPGTNLLAVHGLNAAADDADFLILPELLDVERFDTGTRFFNEPTPGEPNNAGINNNGPPITEVSHSPHVPTPGEPIVVAARITPGPLGFTSATMTYRVMYDAEVTLPMVDDGSGDDTTAGDGIYTATIPGDVYLAGQMVRYYISAVDTAGNPSRKPEFFRPDQSAEYFGTVATDPAIPDTELPVLQWFVPDPDWHKIPTPNNRDLSTASVFYDGVFYDNIRVRVRGGVTQNQLKPNLKFDFYSGGRFEYSSEAAAVEEFNLQSLYGEIPTRTYMRDPLAYQVFRDAGMAAPYSFYIHVRQNGQFYSLAAMTEQMDATFLERYGLDPEGALYKASSDAKLQPNPTALQYTKATRRLEDYSDLAALTDGLSLTDPTAREQFVYDNINIPEIIHYLAITLLGPNHDRIAHNYYVYRDTNDTGEWSMLPWDLDRWFPQGTLLTSDVVKTIFYGDSDHPRISGTADTYNRMNDALFDISGTREMFLAHLRTVVDQYMGTSYLEDSVAAIQALIADDAALDNAKWGTGDFAAGVAAILNTIATRRAQLAADTNIPAAPADPTSNIAFGTLDYNPASGIQDEEYLTLVNNNAFAVDISQWQLTGGIEYTFQHGTVIPAGGVLYVSPNVKAFRLRGEGPSGGQGLFVQGDYSGHISNQGELIELLTASDSPVASIITPIDLSPAQRYLRISEIMYNPPAPTTAETQAGFTDNDDFEFIELVNTSESETLVLDGVAFTQGITSVFADADPGLDEVTLAPGGRLVLVRDLDAFQARYDIAGMTLAGPYRDFDGGNKLSNDGETIKLEDARGSTIAEFRYNDNPSEGWPAEADGQHGSLEVVHTESDLDSADAWYASPQWGGSPGVAATASVLQQMIFYDGSAWDTGGDVGNDAAIAPDKTALLPGQTAGLANYSSFEAGLNGLMIDIAHPADIARIDADDFTFRVGNIDDVSLWSLASTPTVQIRPGEGRGGSDRIVLTWDAAEAVHDAWLEITLLAASTDTGLLADSVGYFGHAGGKTGNDPSSARVDAADLIAIRNHPHGAANPAAIDDRYDINRDRSVDAIDLLLARNSIASPLEALRLISPSVPMAAPIESAEGASADLLFVRAIGLVGKTRDAAPIRPECAGAEWSSLVAEEENLPLALPVRSISRNGRIAPSVRDLPYHRNDRDKIFATEEIFVPSLPGFLLAGE